MLSLAPFHCGSLPCLPGALLLGTLSLAPSGAAFPVAAFPCMRLSLPLGFSGVRVSHSPPGRIHSPPAPVPPVLNPSGAPETPPMACQPALSPAPRTRTRSRPRPARPVSNLPPHGRSYSSTCAFNSHPVNRFVDFRRFARSR